MSPRNFEDDYQYQRKQCTNFPHEGLTQKLLDQHMNWQLPSIAKNDNRKTNIRDLGLVTSGGCQAGYV